MSEQATEQQVDDEQTTGADDAGQDKPADKPDKDKAADRQSIDDLPAWAQTELRKVRDEAAANRVKAREGETQRDAMLRALAKAAGVELPGDNAKADPEALSRDLTAAREARRDTAVQLAVYRTAGKHSLDGDALLDSRSFLNTVSDLDPDAKDFTSKVEKAVTAASEGGKFRTGRAPGASSVDAPGGRTARNNSDQPQSLHGSVSAHYQS